MEETKETYAYETNPNSEELLKIKKAELKDLKKKAARDRTVRLANGANRRLIRDDKIDKINSKLKAIKDIMVQYNKAGKRTKDGIDILGDIYNLVRNDVELTDEIARTMPEVSQDEMQSEAVDESEVSAPGE